MIIHRKDLIFFQFFSNSQWIWHDDEYVDEFSAEEVFKFAGDDIKGTEAFIKHYELLEYACFVCAKKEKLHAKWCEGNELVRIAPANAVTVDQNEDCAALSKELARSSVASLNFRVPADWHVFYQR